MLQDLGRTFQNTKLLFIQQEIKVLQHEDCYVLCNYIKLQRITFGSFKAQRCTWTTIRKSVRFWEVAAWDSDYFV